MTTYFPQVEAWMGHLRYGDTSTNEWVDVFSQYADRNGAIQGAQGNLQSPYSDMGTVAWNVIYPVTSLPSMST